MIDWNRIKDPVARLHGFVSGFHATYYVYTGIECGLFEALVDPQTPSDLSTQLDLSQPYVRRFCEIGLRWGLLDVEPADDGHEDDETSGETGSETRYSFCLREPFVQPLAIPESARYMGDFFRFATVHASEDYLDYPEYFRSGETRPFTSHDAAFTNIIEGSTSGLQTIFVEKLIPESLPSFDAQLLCGGRIFDIGCGTGYLACQLCERHPDLTVVGVDLDEDAIDRARVRAGEAGLSDRTTFRVGDATTLSVESTDAFDAAVLFMSLHEIAADRRTALFEKLGSVLGEDGVIAVFDEVYPAHPSEFDQQPFAAGVETQWSELIWGNIIPTLSEQRDLLDTAELTEQSRTTFADRFVVYEGVSNDV